MELISTLGIDWKLLVAQLVNFLLLIGVLSYFVYRPVLNLLDERRERIRKSMDDAKSLENQRKEVEEMKTVELRKIDAEAGKFLENAKKEAEKAKQQILATAQKEAEQFLQKAKQQLENEKTKMVADIQASLAKIVVRLSEKVIEREFSKADQDRLMGSLEKVIPSLVR